VRALVSAAGGGALLLCTARARMQLMRDALDGLGLRVLVLQLGADLGSLVSDFRDDPDSVLIASRGAFEGVDVRGESLRLVVLDRLPFPHLDDPIIAALGRIGRGWGDESLPRAVMAARQAFGRLIRSTDDRGVIALLDGRALTRSYGAEFVQEPFTTNLADVEAFFADGAAA
jgi:ATP-dependent DNA helicase DinG